jgi:serine/threonine-protein kinase RsbW
MEYKRVFQSDPDLLPEIDKYIHEIAEENNLSQETINNLSLSVAEAASNAIIHGNKGNKEKTIRLTLEIMDDKLIVRIKDQGEGFDPNGVPDPTAPENILNDSGRGIHIIKTFSNLDYKFDEEGTETIITIYRS